MSLDNFGFNLNLARRTHKVRSTLASRGVVNKKNDNLQQWAIGAANITQTDHSNTLKVHPFLKYAGGKGQLLPELDKLIPPKFNRYFEPFLGGGTFFFYLVSKGMKFNAYLSDASPKLITSYKVVKDNPRGLIELLQVMSTNTRSIHLAKIENNFSSN